jgi:acyl carrier protein
VSGPDRSTRDAELETIGRFVAELTPDGTGEPVAPDFPLLRERVLDSLGLRRLIAFVERSFAVEVPDEELLPENFDTVRSVARLVDRLRAPAS